MRRFEIAALIVAVIALLCLLWLAAKVGHGETIAFDENVRGAIQSVANSKLTRLFEAITLLGSQAFVITVTACAALVMFFEGRRDRALLMVVAMAGAELLLSALKIHFHRRRPEPILGVLLPGSYSFPSGHALLSFCCYGTLAALYGGRARLAIRSIAAMLILAVGFSRVYLGVHYPSDVIGGYLLATVWMACLAILYSRLATMKR